MSGATHRKHRIAESGLPCHPSIPLRSGVLLGGKDLVQRVLPWRHEPSRPGRSFLIVIRKGH